MSIRNNYKHTFYASYAGYFVQAIINNFIPLLFLTFQNSFNLSYDKISLLIVINFGVQLFVDFLSAYFIDKIGYRVSVIAAHVFATLGLAGLSIFPFIMNPYAGIRRAAKYLTESIVCMYLLLIPTITVFMKSVQTFHYIIYSFTNIIPWEERLSYGEYS